MGTICGHLENYCQELTGSLDTESTGLIITVPEIKEMINVHILSYDFFHYICFSNNINQMFCLLLIEAPAIWLELLMLEARTD